MAINPETGKRWYRKKDRRTLQERLADDGHDGVWFLRKCQTCRKVYDREELFEFPWDETCLICRRRKERAAEGHLMPALSPKATATERHGAAVRVGKAAAKKRREVAATLLQEWKAARRQELLAEGVKDWQVFSRLLQEAPAMREKLGLPPSESPYSI